MMLGDKVKILGGGPLAGEEFTGCIYSVEYDTISVEFDEPIMFPGNKLHEEGIFSVPTGFFVMEDVETDILFIPNLNTSN